MGRKLILGACVVAAAGISAALVAGTACHVDVPFYCCTTQKSCEEDHGGGVITGCLPRYPDRPYCDDDGTHPASEGVGRTCIADPFPDQGTICVSSQDCTDPAHPACINQHCQGCATGADCTAAAPVCSDAHTCTACTQESDCASYASTPHCGSTGACVACRDGADCPDPAAPSCDSGTAACRACREDAECGSKVCDEGTGRCLAESEIVYVDGVAGVLSGTCSQATPCKTIQLGVDAVSGGRSHVRVAPGTYTDRVTISGKTLQLLALGAQLAPVSVGTGIEVKGLSSVTIEGIHIKDVAGGSNGDGVNCAIDNGNSPTLSLISVTIERSSALGVNATKCKLTMTGSTIIGNVGGGVSLTASDFSLTNNLIVKNGGSLSGIGGVLISQNPLTGPSAARFEFNTVADNTTQGGGAGGVVCSAVGMSLSFENDIIYGNGTSTLQVEGGSCSWSYSDIGPGGSTVPGTGNINAAPMFVDQLMNDYHLMQGSPAINVADPGSTVNVDIDGDARPAGGRSDMGADEVQ